MSNDFYTVGGTPSTGSNLQSAPVRTEFALIQTGFDKLPALTANGGKTVRVNAGATALEVSKVTITEPATGSTLTIADGKTLTASNTLTLTGTDGSSVAFGAGGTVAYTANKLSAFAATTSAELAGVLSDETGSGKLMLNDSPAVKGTWTVESGTWTIPAHTLGGTVTLNGQSFSGVLGVTKTTAGDAITFTNGAASNKTGYLYTDNTYIGFGTTASAAAGDKLLFSVGNYAQLNGTSHTYLAVGGSTIVDATSTGAAVTGTLSATGNTWIFGGSSLYLQNASANHSFSLVNSGGSGVSVASLSSSLAVTGSGTYSGGVTSNRTTGAAFTATADAGYALFDGVTNSSGGRFGVTGNTTGNGTNIVSYNNAQNAYEPLNIYATTTTIKTTGSATVAAFSSAGESVTGAITCSTGFGCNGAAAQTKYTVNAASTDLSTVVALCNQLRAALVANGICV